MNTNLMSKPWTVVFGLDPGASCGFARCAFEGEKITVLEYGIVPVKGNDTDSIVRGIQHWIQQNHPAEFTQHLVFSAIPYIPGRRTHHASIEVQGVIRAAGGIGYSPSTIHSQLGTRNKADTIQFVTRVLGWKPVSITHITDAFAVCMAHALKTGVWQPHIEALPTGTPEQGGKRRGGRSSAIGGDSVGETPTQEQLREMVRTGKARVK
jgi:Holliday junction resolvasome RuvABC endonuclease subunit